MAGTARRVVWQARCRRRGPGPPAHDTADSYKPLIDMGSTAKSRAFLPVAARVYHKFARHQSINRRYKAGRGRAGAVPDLPARPASIIRDSLYRDAGKSDHSPHARHGASRAASGHAGARQSGGRGTRSAGMLPAGQRAIRPLPGPGVRGVAGEIAARVRRPGGLAGSPQPHRPRRSGAHCGDFPATLSHPQGAGSLGPGLRPRAMG